MFTHDARNEECVNEKPDTSDDERDQGKAADDENDEL